VGEYKQPLELKREISGLIQKVCILGDNLAIAWAGSKIAATLLIKYLNEENQKHELAYEGMPEVLEKFNRIDNWTLKQDFQIVGCFLKREPSLNRVKINRFGLNCDKTASSKFPDMYIAGTGRDELVASIEKSAQCLKTLSGAPKKIEEALTFAGSVIGNLQNIEINRELNMKMFFGGAYEIASIPDLKFRKLSNFVYCFWKIDGGADKFGVNLLKVIKPMYFNNLLLLRVIDFTPNIKTGSFQTPPLNELHIIEPMSYQKISYNLKNIPIPPLHDTYYFNYVWAEYKDGNELDQSLLTLVEKPVNNPPPVAFHEEKGHILSREVCTNYIEKMIHQYREHLSSKSGTHKKY